MEARLFWIGVTMGAYAWATKRWKAGLDGRKAAAAWHGLFYALAGFAVTLVAVLSIESRMFPAASGSVSLRELLPGVVGGLVLGFWGYWSAWKDGAQAAKRREAMEEDLEWAETVFSAVLLAAVLMYFVIQAFKIPSGSMESTLRIGDHLFVNKFIYGVRIPYTHKRLLRMRPVRRGDIVVFQFPSDDAEELHCGSPQYGKDFIKRVIGLPGDTVEVRDGAVWVNGAKAADEPYAQFLDPFRAPRPSFPPASSEYQRLWQERRLDQTMGDAMRDHFGPVRVPEASYFVMGDNRDRSCDGRFWGPVGEGYLKGKAWVVYWPPSRMGRIR